MPIRTVAIMQPTYLPWIGYFDLMDQVDCFVFLDSVQFNKRSWQQRNRIKGPDGALWLTVPVLSKGLWDQRIVEVEIDPSNGFAEKHLRTIEHLYKKAPYFEDYAGELSEILRRPHQYLGDLNIDLICWLAGKMGVEGERVRSSQMEAQGRNVELLLHICKLLGAGRYLSPEGSRVYIEENNLFIPNGIELVYQAYHHPEYRQLNGPFAPHLSALDFLFNEGPASLSVIRSGCHSPLPTEEVAQCRK